MGEVPYTVDRAETPWLQEVCSVMALHTGNLIMSFHVDFGASGAPIFSFFRERPRIASVVTVKAELRGRRVALSTASAKSLELLQVELSQGRGLTALTDSGSGNLGAKFPKP